MINNKRSVLEVDMQKLVFSYLNRWWLLLIGAVITAILFLFYTIFFVTPIYSAGVTVYVNSSKGGEEVTNITNTSLVTAQRLVNTYIKIIESDSVLTKVAEASQLDISADDIRRSMSAEQVDNTELFKVHIAHSDPELAAQIANAVAEVAPREIEDVVAGSSTKIIDYAKVPRVPSSPNTKKNCVLGGVGGFVLVLAYLTARFLLDVRIKDEDELTMLFDAPVLGQIPAFTSENTKRYEAEGKAYDTSAAQQKEEAK